MNWDWIGYQWLSETYRVEPAQPFSVTSRIGKTRSTTTMDGIRTDIYPEPYRPKATLADHLSFALKYEGVHLEFLARLFSSLPKDDMEAWVNSEPSGQYARRAGFFYEWLTGRELDFPGVSIGNYVSALPEEEYLTRDEPLNVGRWRVRNNLPGTAHYCPVVRRTPRLKDYESYDCLAQLNELEAEFGTDILARSAVWLTIKESRASFLIEREESQTDRVKRFASVMERRLGEEDDPLSDEFLASIQSEILGDRALRSGPRQSPVFVGETGLTEEIVHYVAPHWDHLATMLDGLREFAATTTNHSPLIRAAVLSFGFVFIHPMADGNGRISRFLVNDTLRRDGAAPAPYLLPISATITRTLANRAAYDRALEHYSKPLMHRYREACSFGAWVECQDGVKTNFRFSAYTDAQFSWAFPDLTIQSEYLCDVIRETIESEMRQEAGFLFELRQTRARVKEVIEAPDVEIDRIIRSIKENRGTISGKLQAEFAILADAAIAAQVVTAIMGEARIGDE